MPLFQAIILGIVQGATEFIPVSSSGHLVVFPLLFGWAEQPLVFDTTMHLATVFALLFYFWKDIINIFRAFFADVLSSHRFSLKEYSSEALLGLNIIIGSVPVALVGYFWGDAIENQFRAVVFVAIFLVFGSVLMFVSEKQFSKRLVVKDEVSTGKGFGIGLFQIFSLLPGVSRSGSTISGGMILGISRKDATKFSFLISIPVLLMAGILNLLRSYKYLMLINIFPLAVGFLSAFIVGIISINFLIKFVRTNTLYPFIIYRVLLAGFLIFLVLR